VSPRRAQARVTRPEFLLRPEGAKPSWRRELEQGWERDAVARGDNDDMEMDRPGILVIAATSLPCPKADRKTTKRVNKTVKN
jgi:hypothetical protein